MGMSETIVVRVPEGTKEKLRDLSEAYNKTFPGANFSPQSIVRNAILRRIEEKQE